MLRFTSFLAVCHCLLIIFSATLHIWRLSPTFVAWWGAVTRYQVGDNSWWFSEAALKSIGNSDTVLGVLMLHVRWILLWNVTQHQLGEPSAPDSNRFFWTACISFVPWSWRLQICPTVSYYLPCYSYYLPCYMRHICGLQSLFILAEYVQCL
jgi:hypothetical protein